MVPRISFYKDPYLRKLTQGTDNLGLFEYVFILKLSPSKIALLRTVTI